MWFSRAAQSEVQIQYYIQEKSPIKLVLLAIGLIKNIYFTIPRKNRRVINIFLLSWSNVKFALSQRESAECECITNHQCCVIQTQLQR